MDEILRKQVRHFLADHEDITKKELAEYLEIRPDSFYNWLDRQYNFSSKTKERLQDILDTLN